MPTAKQPDALASLGTLIGAHEKRDAIHIAVAPAVAASMLTPGMHVGFLPDGTVGVCEETVGIVDPFLRTLVKRGDRFWLFVYPRQITSLRHVWSHPAFADKAEKVEVATGSPVPTEAQRRSSEEWLRAFVDRSDCPEYDTVIAAATEQHHLNGGTGGYECSRNNGEYLHFGGSDAHGEIPPEFWDHVSVIQGKEVPREKRASYFSCSC